jgi:hypothetical protein
MKSPGAQPRATGAEGVPSTMTNTSPRGRSQARLVEGGNPTRVTVENFSSIEGAGLIIEHTTTADMPDGQSLPPFIDKDVAIWHAVDRLPGGYTRWRRIRIGLLSEERRILAWSRNLSSSSGG